MTMWAVYTLADHALIEVVHGDPAATEGYPWDASTMGCVDLGVETVDFMVKAWDAASRSLVDNLDALRAMKWQAIKAQREARRVVISTSWGLFDADETAKTNLLGRLTAISLGATDDVVWKLHDNSFATIPAADFPAACMAVMAGVEAVYAASFALEAALGAATTAAEIASIDPTEGWPE